MRRNFPKEILAEKTAIAEWEKDKTHSFAHIGEMIDQHTARISVLVEEYKHARARWSQQRRCLDCLESEAPTENKPSEFDASKLPLSCCHREAVQLAAGGHGKRGLFIHGRSGQGKTWAAVMAAAAVIEAEAPANVQFIDAADLKNWLSGLRGEDKGEFINDLASKDVLVINDLGHGMSESFAESMRLILSARPEEYVTIFTSQFSLVEILDRAAGEKYARGVEAILRRVDDRCSVLEFCLEAEEEIKSRIPGQVPF